ncbi:serine hydrolase domain-containing protein [Acidobacteriota bacterium]
MQTCKKQVLILITIVCLFSIGGICQTGQSVDTESFKNEIQIKLDFLQSEDKFPGATLGIVLPDGTEIALASGWADIENKIIMKPLDRIFTGSAGKTFVAAVALQLVQEEKLDLEEKVSTYLGEEPWYSRLPNHNDLTVRMIMQHTGGLPRYVFKEAFIDKLLEIPDKVWKPEEILTFVFDDTPEHHAGEGWSYSDTDYIVLGMIIEKITEDTYYNELESRILRPFGFKNTTPSISRVLKGLVTGYTGDKTPPFKFPGKLPVNGLYPVNPQFEWCGGGLITTSLDMARWAKLLYEGKVFSAELLEEMLKPVDFRTGEPGKQGYGLGAMIFNAPFGLIYGHSGMFPGYETQMSYFPRWKIAISIQVNADSFSGKLNGNLNRFIEEFVPILEKYFGN